MHKSKKLGVQDYILTLLLDSELLRCSCDLEASSLTNPRGLVKPLAIIFCVGTFWMVSCFFDTSSSTYWNCTSMFLVFSFRCASRLIVTAPELSFFITGALIFIWRFSTRLVSHQSCLAHLFIATNSASVVDWETTSCLFADQQIGLLYMVITYPKVYFFVTREVA